MRMEVSCREGRRATRDGARSADSRGTRARVYSGASRDRRRGAPGGAPMWNNRTGRCELMAIPCPEHPPCSIPPSTPNSQRSSRRRAADGGRGHEAVRMRRPHDVSRAAGGRRAAGERSAGRRRSCERCHAARRAGRRARRRARACRAARCRDKRGVVLSLAKFRRILVDRSGRAHGGRAAGRAQPRDLRGRRAARPLLRARSVVADRLLDRRQRRRERRRRPLPQVRAHRAQRAPRARRAHHRRGRRVRRRRARQRRATTCSRSSHGSEGLLAVTTEITVKLLPKPQVAQVALAAFDDVESGGRGGRRHHRRRHRAGGPRDDGPARRRARSRSSCTPTIRSTPRRSCSSSPTARAEEVAAEMARDHARAAPRPARPRSACRRTSASGCCSGRGARRRFPRSAASRRTTTASTARFRARALRAGAEQIEALVGASSACAAPTCSTPATATCIR